MRPRPPPSGLNHQGGARSRPIPPPPASSCLRPSGRSSSGLALARPYLTRACLELAPPPQVRLAPRSALPELAAAHAPSSPAPGQARSRRARPKLAHARPGWSSQHHPAPRLRPALPESRSAVLRRRTNLRRKLRLPMKEAICDKKSYYI
jgi:hypothetical protein